jgi:hypothetical protein
VTEEAVVKDGRQADGAKDQPEVILRTAGCDHRPDGWKGRERRQQQRIRRAEWA